MPFPSLFPLEPQMLWVAVVGAGKSGKGLGHSLWGSHNQIGAGSGTVCSGYIPAARHPWGALGEGAAGRSGHLQDVGDDVALALLQKPVFVEGWVHPQDLSKHL